MKTIGIICECNPFHGGHEYLIRRARESGAEAVVCVMSGSFVQRGEAAIVDAQTRARALLSGGADAVLELPYPFCAAGAEFFARAGVEILDRLCVSELWFGSECGDVDLLARLADAADSEELRTRYAMTASGNNGTAEAYFDALCDVAGVEHACASNDILGISYLRAIRALQSEMRAVTVKREGSAYLEQSISKDSFPSATALRRRWREEGLDAILPFLPPAAAEVYAMANAPIADMTRADRLILGYLRLADSETLENVAELGGGLGNRLSELALQSASLSELLTRAATKKYTNARLQRGILFALTGIFAADLRVSPAYVRLLAANQRGCDFLAWARKHATIDVVTRRADLPSTPEALRQAEWERRAWSLYTLCREEIEGTDALWKNGVYIDKSPLFPK